MAPLGIATSSQGEPSNTKPLATIFGGQKRKARDHAPTLSSPRLMTSFSHNRTPSSPTAPQSPGPPPKRPKAGAMSDNMASVAPLADRMRPQTLDDYVGQESVVGKGSLLRGLLDNGSSGSLILVSISSNFRISIHILTFLHVQWGPPGSGKSLSSMSTRHFSISTYREDFFSPYNRANDRICHQGAECNFLRSFRRTSSV